MTGGIIDDDSQRFDLEERLLEFAARIIRLTEAVRNTAAGKHVAGQLLRSGTSPMAQHAEAQSAESRKDFIHKMKVSLKELRETKVWLIMIVRANLIKPEPEMRSLIKENDELISIFVSSIKTAKQNKTKTS